MLENIINLFFPTSCIICGKLYSKPVCPRCYIKLKKEIELKNIKENQYNVYFISFYEKKIKQLILEFKFKEKAYLNEFFAELIIKNKELIENYDYIVPVPMHKTNKNIRGYNQVELLSKTIAKKIKVEYLDCLEKVQQNKKQSLLSEKERRTNVINVYRLIKKEKIYNKKILLIDDIYTTGSTAKECIKELKKGKPKKADVFVISKSKKG